jgi:COMPASS component SWD3
MSTTAIQQQEKEIQTDEYYNENKLYKEQINHSQLLSDSQKEKLLLASSHVYSSESRRMSSQSSSYLFSPNDPKIKEDIIKIILQYLQNEGFKSTRMTLYDEANVKQREWEDQHGDFKRLRKTILEGEYQDVEKLVSRIFVRNCKSFLFLIYKQQYLEFVDSQDLQKAFTFLNKKLKPLESYQTFPNEFKELCYLLSTKSIPLDSPFSSYFMEGGVTGSRERLVENLHCLLKLESGTLDGERNSFVPPNRLLDLFQQALNFQIESSPYHPLCTPKVVTLLSDFQSFVIPNKCKMVFKGHSSNVKCIEVLGEDGNKFCSGSSDCTIRIWEEESGICTATLSGHKSRIWDLSSNIMGTILASASGYVN